MPHLACKWQGHGVTNCLCSFLYHTEVDGSCTAAPTCTPTCSISLRRLEFQLSTTAREALALEGSFQAECASAAGSIKPNCYS